MVTPRERATVGSQRDAEAYPIWPFKITQKIDGNAFQLELLVYMEIYSVININNLKHFEPSMPNDKLEEVLPLVNNLIIDQEMILVEETILEITKMHRG